MTAVIGVDDIKSGMVLTADLFSPGGRLLMPRGAVMGEKEIRIAKIWGVVEAEVSQGPEADGMGLGEMDPELVGIGEEYAERIFVLSDLSHPAMAELKRQCVLDVLERIGQGEDRDRFVRSSLAEIECLGGEIEDIPSSIEEVVDSEMELASFPAVFYKVIEVLQNPRSSSACLAEVIGSDANLSARLMRLVNSPLYGFPSQIDTITRAVTLVGLRELSILALGVSIISHFSDIDPSVMDMKIFWKHSIACGVIARILSAKKQGLSEDRFFLGGLLHDIGSMVLYKNYPMGMNRVISLAARRKRPPHEMEAEIFGFNHARVGGAMMEKWNFPRSLAEMVIGHHEPAGAINRIDSSILHLADIVTYSMGFGGERAGLAPCLSPQAWEDISLKPSFLSMLISQARCQIKGIVHSFLNSTD